MDGIGSDRIRLAISTSSEVKDLDLILMSPHPREISAIGDTVESQWRRCD